MERMLLTGVRRAGANRFRFRVFGHAGNEFPPAELTASPAEMRDWLTHGALPHPAATAAPAPAPRMAGDSTPRVQAVPRQTPAAPGSVPSFPEA